MSFDADNSLEMMNSLPRRQWLQRCGLGIPWLAAAGLLAQESPARPVDAGVAATLPHHRPKARNLIHIFLNGGPSHVDTFDPKPELTRYHGQSLPTPTLVTERVTGKGFGSPFSFRPYGESGIEVSEIFKEVGEVIDDVCVIRSMRAQVPNHEPSLMLMNCGDGALVRPSLGSWLMYGLGSANENLPGFIVLCPGGGGLPVKGKDNWRSSFLPGHTQGTFVDSSQTEISRLIENIDHPHVSQPRQRAQLDLLAQLNQAHLQGRQGDPRLEARIRSYEQAYRMQTEAGEAFDLGQEPEYIRQLYGESPAARQLLMARRLVERGVRFVQCWHGAGQPWDHHGDLENGHRKLGTEISKAIGGLITDLKQRGLLDETLIVWGGEFGRTPTTEGNNGRDHNHFGFSTCLAGGGVNAGSVYGATDEFGWKAVENPVDVHDLHATLLHLLGLDHERLTYRFAGRDFRLTDVYGRVIPELIG